MPAYGTYTGGLDWGDRAFRELLGADRAAILTGERPCRVTMQRAAPARTRLRG